MPALYLVPERGADFPYDQVKAAIEGLASVEISDVDFEKIIADGIRNEWPPQLVENQRQMQQSGKCFNFAQGVEPFLEGTVYLENVYFLFEDEAHADRCAPVIDGMAQDLGLKTSIGFSR